MQRRSRDARLGVKGSLLLLTVEYDALDALESFNCPKISSPLAAPLGVVVETWEMVVVHLDCAPHESTKL